MAIAFVLFYSRATRILNAFANRFEPVDPNGKRSTFPFLKRRNSRNFQILKYHRIGDGGPFLPSMPTAVFRRQLEYLAERFRVWSLEDAVRAMFDGDLPDNVVVITFDDGYRDNFVNGFPIVKELSLTATIFLATESIGSGKILWHDRVFRAFNTTRRTTLDGFGPTSATYSIAGRRQRAEAMRCVLGFLKRLNPEERGAWIDRLVEGLAVEDPGTVPGLMLSWDDIREMSAEGISFGSHTATHPILSRLSHNEARAEIVDSKRAIEDRLGIPVNSFAYPNGKQEDFTQGTKQLLAEAGYNCAVTTIFGTNRIDGNGRTQDPFELRRLGIETRHLSLFATRINRYKFT